MTTRKPTVSARFALLERLARENADTPESRDFAPASLSDLERTSLADGISDLLAYQQERVQEQDRKKLDELKQQALRRAEQRAEARQWEQDFMEQNRRREFSLRLKEAKRLAMEEAKQNAEAYREESERELAIQAKEAELTREITMIEAEREKKHWRRGAIGSATLAAVACLVWAVAPSHVQTSASHKIASLWDQAAETENATRARVAELEAEIRQREYLSAGEKSLLETELVSAKMELASAEETKDAVDRKRPTAEGPRRLAAAPAPATAPRVHANASPEKKPDGAIRVASDSASMPVCDSYDPMCFEL